MVGHIGTRTLRGGEVVYDVCVELPRSAEGKRRQRWIRGLRTREAAQAQLNVLLETRGSGAIHDAEDRNDRLAPAPPPRSQTFGEFLPTWLETIRPTVRPATYSSYADLVATYLLPHLGAARLDELAPIEVASIMGGLLTSGRQDGVSGLSPRTVRYCHAILKRALSDACAWGLAERNAAALVKPPRNRFPEISFWTAEQVSRFLHQVRDDPLYSAWVLCCTTGMRRGEVLGLQWRDVDLEAGRIFIRRALVSVRYALVISEPKTRRGRRAVELDRTTVDVLKDHLARQEGERERSVSGEELVLCQADGSPIHPDRFYRAFCRHARRAGLPRIRLHDLRHTYASLALAAGIHPKVVSERLGHANITITLELYSHVVPGLQREAAEKVAALIF